MGKSVKMPKYALPDPKEIIDKEVEVNRFDMVNPYGSTKWTKDPATGRFTQTVSLADDVEAIRQQQIQRASEGTNKNPFEALAQASPEMAGISAGLQQRVAGNLGGNSSKPQAQRPTSAPPVPSPAVQQQIQQSPVAKMNAGG